MLFELKDKEDFLEADGGLTKASPMFKVITRISVSLLIAITRNLSFMIRKKEQFFWSVFEGS